MTLLSDVATSYLSAQILAGADAVQLFDSWIGVLDPATYNRSIYPYMRGIYERLQPLGAPVIYFGTGTSALLPAMQMACGDVMGVDWRISLTQAASSLKPTPLQGNLDPAVLLTTPDIVASKAAEIVEQGRSLPGHIFNLGHGIFPDTPLENVERLVQVVQGR